MANPSKGGVTWGRQSTGLLEEVTGDLNKQFDSQALGETLDAPA